MTSPQEIYVKVLTRNRPELGYPLWHPEPDASLPTEYRVGLQIGDVGVVHEDGSFKVFFNLCLPPDHPLHRARGVPHGFKQLVLTEQDVQEIPSIYPPGRIVASEDIRLNASVSRGRQSFRFVSNAKEGAILVLPKGADGKDLLREAPFILEAERNAKAWYEFARRRLRCPIQSNSLYMITGLRSASSWSLAAFKQQSGCFAFDATLTTDPMGDYTWRSGPDPYNGIKNQTVSIRGFKIAIRNKIWGFLGKDVVVRRTSPVVCSSKIASPRSLALVKDLELTGDDGQPRGDPIKPSEQLDDNVDMYYQVNARKVNHLVHTS
ncbi:hypothetical protein ID866_9470 [Astraeus odoratus]|nr:hypothetical protein ID866_9470 [Astraeus odoratus]